MTALRMEFWKSRRRGLWLVCAALLGVELLWIIWAFRNPTEKQKALGWLDLMYNMPLLNGVLVPVIAGTLASRIADLEHRGNTLKLLETIQPKTQLFHAKLLFGALHLLPLALLQVSILLVMGFHYGFYGQPNLFDYGLYTLFMFTSCFAIYELHLLLSLAIKNQVVPLCIGLGGSFIALLLMFLPYNFARLLCGPYGFFGALSFIWMEDWDPETRIIKFVRMPTPWGTYAVLIGWIIVIYLAGRIVLKRKEL